MAHLTYFDTIEEYNAYINSEDYVKPNISYCADVDAVFMKEDFIPSMSAVFNITETGSTKIINSVNDIKAIRIDGQLLAQNSTTYSFTDTGEHTVEYQFRRQGELKSNMFYSENPTGSEFSALTSADITNLVSIGSYNFTNCPNLSFGNITINGNIENNCFQGVSILNSAEVNGNIGDNNFLGITNLSAMTINGNVGNSNFTGDLSLKTIRINGNIGNNNIAGVPSLTDVYIDGSVGDNNFGGVNSITSMTINGSVGNGNYFYGFDTLHIKGDYAGGGYLSNVKHLIVDGNMGSSVSPGSGLEDIVIKGNLGGGNFGRVSTLTAITISGDVGSNNFAGCQPINTVKIGGELGAYNFSYYTHGFDSVEIGKDVTGNSNYFNGNTELTSHITINGSAIQDNRFTSGDTLIIKGDCGSRTINYWKNVTIEGDISGYGVSFTSVQNVVISGDVKGSNTNWGLDGNVSLQKESFIVTGDVVANNCFNNMIGPMVQVGGSIANHCFENINITDGTTSYTIHGNVGYGSFNNVSGLTDITVDGNVDNACFGITGSNNSNSITSLTLTENCSSFGGFQTTSITKFTIQRTTPPTLSGSIPSGITIYVPASVVDTYKAATGWSTYASQIEAIPNE